MKRFLLRLLCTPLLLLVMGLLLTFFSPIYNFREPAPFKGPDIFNPYRNLDTAWCWQRSVFHVHTRVKGPWPVNECPEWPGEVYQDLAQLGYDIVTFSNHNELTTHPFDTALQVNVYEHGYNLFKFHKLVFGSQKVIHFDPLIPILASQKQFQLDYLGRSAHFIQMNHPYRTVGTCKRHMEELSGYQIMELDTGISTENEYWDWALSAGHYSFGLANDDLHHPEVTSNIGVRCNFLCTPSGRYEDIKKTLLEGCYYAMRVPDYGNGDWQEKRARNKRLPYVTGIGLRADTLFMTLSRPAASILVTGQDHTLLYSVGQTSSLAYALPADAPYARITAIFDGGEVIYSNPFARYDASAQDSPFCNDPQPWNIPLTVLYNLLVLALLAGCLLLLGKLYAKR